MKKAVVPVTTAFLLTAARLISADLPTGGQVTAGSAAISSAGNTLTVTQTSAKAIINWQDFSVGSGHAVRFAQPDASAVALNRVVGTSASLIDGALSANGRVFLVNPNGVLFGAGAQVEVGGLVASTLALRDADFLAGNYVFDGAGAGIVANHGRIVTVGDGQGGFIAMLAAQVVNEGTLQADRGSVALVAADRVTLDLGGLVGVSVGRGSLAALVDNGGAIRADGGRVYLTARAADELASAAINHDGVIEARTLATGEKGSIVLLGDLEHGSLVADGRLDASAPAGGDGGFIETSAAQVSFGSNFAVTTAAAQGAYGTWLLDPEFIEIVGTGGLTVGAANAQATGVAQISVSTLSTALNTANVTLEATSQIDFKVAFNHAGTRDAVLTLLAPTIALGGDITATGSKLGLNFGGVGATTYAGNVFLFNPAGSAVITRTLATNGGNMLFNGNIGGAHDLALDAGSGQVRMAATVDGVFNARQQVYGDLAFRYQAGGRVGDITTIDFANRSVSFDNNGVIYTANQSEISAISGRPLSFPTGYLVIPGGTVMDLNAKNVPIIRTDSAGNTFTGELVGTNNGQVTFPANPLTVSKLQFEQTNGSWTEVLAVGISWVANQVAGKPRNLEIKAANVTIDAGKTLAVDGNITVSTAKFVNNSGPTALQPGTGKTWQVWSSNPAPHDPTTGDVDGDLPYDYKQYGATYGVTPPAGTGSGMFYTYVPQATFSLTGSITKVYDGTRSASNLLNANYALTGAVDGDVLTKAGSLPTNGLYVDKNVGTSKSVTATGLSTANFTVVSSTGKPVYGYGLSSTSATGNIGIITKATISNITGTNGVTAENRQYNGLLGATLNLAGVTLVGLVPTDDLTLTGGTGAFVTPDVGVNKTVVVNGLTFSGADLNNYDLPTSFNLQASITRAPLTVTAANASKTYDGQGFSGGNGVSYSGFVNGETSSVLGGTLTYGGSSQGAINAGAYAITPGGLTSDNYQFIFQDGVLTITGAPAPAVDVRVFLPVPVLVPVLAVPPVAVRLPATPGGLNYVPASRPVTDVVAFAPSSVPAGTPAVNPSPSPSADASPVGGASVTEAVPAGPTGSRRAQDGVTRSLMGPLDVIVVNGGVNLGVRPVVAE